jgi:hypothetical protein
MGNTAHGWQAFLYPSNYMFVLPLKSPKNPANNQMLMLQQHLERLCKTFPF